MTAPLSPFDEAGRQWAWDSTSIKRAETCARKYQYEALEGWRSPHQSVHLWFGSLYATALEHFHTLHLTMSWEEALVEVVREALIKSWTHDLDEEGKPIEGTGAPTEFNHNMKTRDTLIRTIVWYFDAFKEDHYATFITADGSAAVEHSFQLPVDNGITFSGHIDRLCVDPEGNIFVHDQKTTGQTLSPYYFKQFKPDSQFSMYTFASKMIYHTPVSGVIVDAAQIAVGFSRFARSPTFRTNDELNEWYDETMMLIERTRGYAATEFYPRNPSACNNFGGCVFREVCSRPPSVRKNFLEGDFVKAEIWNPLRSR